MDMTGTRASYTPTSSSTANTSDTHTNSSQTRHSWSSSQTTTTAGSTITGTTSASTSSTNTNTTASASNSRSSTSHTTSTGTTTSHSKSKSRRKVCDLKCSEIRWFYRRENDSKWIAFPGYDSTILEFAYRKKRGIELDNGMKEIEAELPDTEHVILLNGLYRLESDNEDEVVPIYWKDEPIKIRRGSWFFVENMQPLPTDLADAIEKQHLIGFRGQIIPDSPVFSEAESSKKPVLISLKWSESEEVRWNSVIDVSISNLKRGNRILRFVTRARSTSCLRRGYNEDTIFSEGLPNFTDLILVIHGIGQKGYENLIAKNTTQIRDGINQLMEKNYPDEHRRPIILPIEWRSSLTLDAGLTEVVTLPRMPSMRNTLNSVAMDIMYYQSPLYRTEIANGVIRTMNNVYSVFMKNNPSFKGSVSVYAHSLGSVIAYDILTKWSPFSLYDQFVTSAIHEYMDKCDADQEKNLLEDFHNSRKKLLEAGGVLKKILCKQEEELKFKVKYLFCVGSPLAVFIIMRGDGNKAILPDKTKISRIFNIFHPYDPVAYRLEPLFHENYRYIRPLKLFNYGDAKRQYESLPFECHKSYLKRKKKERIVINGKNDDESKTEKAEDNDSDSGDCSSVHTACSSPRSESPMGRKSAPPPHPPPPNFDSNRKSQIEVHESIPDPLLVGEAGELLEEIPPNKRAPMRIDFQLQPALTDKSYWSVLKSHFNYWTNLDVTAFVINSLYPSLPPISSVQAPTTSTAD